MIWVLWVFIGVIILNFIVFLLLVNHAVGKLIEKIGGFKK